MLAIQKSYQGDPRATAKQISRAAKDVRRFLHGRDERQAKRWWRRLLECRTQPTPAVFAAYEGWREYVTAKEREASFEVVITGLGKAGKSLLGNAIIDKEGELQVDANPCTDTVQAVRWGDLRLVDTPGIDPNGRLRDEERARQAIQLADLVLVAKNVEHGELDAPSLLWLGEILDRKIPVILVHTFSEDKALAKRVMKEDRRIISRRFKRRVGHEAVAAYWYFEGPRRHPRDARKYQGVLSGIGKLRKRILTTMRKDGVAARKAAVDANLTDLFKVFEAWFEQELQRKQRRSARLDQDTEALEELVAAAQEELNEVYARAEEQQAQALEVFKRWDRGTSGFFTYLWDIKLSFDDTIRERFSSDYLPRRRIKQGYAPLHRQVDRIMAHALDGVTALTGAVAGCFEAADHARPARACHDGLLFWLTGCTELDEGDCWPALERRYDVEVFRQIWHPVYDSAWATLLEARRAGRSALRRDQKGLHIKDLEDALRRMRSSHGKICK